MDTQIKELQKKGYLSYLTAMLPRQYGVTKVVAKRLNDSHKKSIKGYEYSPNIVNQIIHKGYGDPNVESILIEIVEEFYGKPLESVAPGFERRFTQYVAKSSLN